MVLIMVASMAFAILGLGVVVQVRTMRKRERRMHARREAARKRLEMHA